MTLMNAESDVYVQRMAEAGAKARAAAAVLAQASADTRDAALRHAAAALRASSAKKILEENARDIAKFHRRRRFCRPADAQRRRVWKPWRADWRRSPTCPTRSAARWRNGPGRTGW